MKLLVNSAAGRRPARFCELPLNPILIVLAGFALGCARQAPPAEETAPPAPVKWMEARQLFIEEWTELLGTTQPLPDHAARITAPLEGQVVSVLQDSHRRTVTEGQAVKKGNVIVQLDASIARANRDKAEAAYEEYQQLIQQAELGVKLAEIELRRLQELAKESTTANLVSPIDIEKAQVALEDANSKRRGAQLHAKSSEKELKALDEQLKLYTLTAPLNGRLGRLQVVPGQTIAPGTLVTEVLDIGKEIDVLCFVPPHTAERLKIGQPARIGGIGQPSGDSSARSEGRVQFIADQAEVDTGNFAVKVRFPNTALRLPGNLTLRLRVLTVPGKAALTLPESAILEDQDPPTVLVVEDYKLEKTADGKETETGKVRSLQVKVGMRDRVLQQVEILGLKDPDNKWQGSPEAAKFIYEKGKGLRTGDAVKLEAEDEDEAAGDKNG
jgi:RND family efflux transporter MFP subunit